MVSVPTSCDWCPRRCGANRREGEAGVCGADGTLRIARAALHFWEEPPISGTAGSGAVFFSHCPLQCAYCQNVDISKGRAGHEVSVARLADICLELQGKGALNINFVTPTQYAGHIVDAVRMARGQGLAVPIVWNTSGYETAGAVRALAGTVDVCLADFKYASPDQAIRYSNAGDYPDTALAALDCMVAQVGAPVYETAPNGDVRLARGVVVRHLLLPGSVGDSMRAVCLLHERYGSDVLLSLMNQYTPVIHPQSAVARRCPELLQTVPEGEYDALLDYADSIGVVDYFWQEGGAAEESFIPAFDGFGVLPA